MSIFVPLPVPGATITDAILKELRKRGVIPADITAFHALDGYAAAFGGTLSNGFPATHPTQKRWSDTGTPMLYLTFAGMLDAQDTATWSDESMRIYGPTVVKLYQDYAKAGDLLRWIPKFKVFVDARAAEMNFLPDVGRQPGPRMVNGSEVPYPIGKEVNDSLTGWSWPTNHAARMNPETRVLEVFHIEDFMREYPIKTTVSTGGSAKGTAAVKPGQASAMLSAAAQAFFGGNHEAAAAKIISDFVEVK